MAASASLSSLLPLYPLFSGSIYACMCFFSILFSPSILSFFMSLLPLTFLLLLHTWLLACLFRRPSLAFLLAVPFPAREVSKSLKPALENAFMIKKNLQRTNEMTLADVISVSPVDMKYFSPLHVM